MTTSEGWASLEPKLNPEIVEAIKKAFNFEFMMPIQKATLPIFTKNCDVAVQAATGSGKTLAYIVPMLEYALKNINSLTNTYIYGLILAPTRELAKQIHLVLSSLLKAMNRFNDLLLIGGTNLSSDIEAFQQKGANFIVATPGKLREALEAKIENFTLRTAEIVILDEADRLLEHEFHDEMTVILHNLAKQRRTGIFSATLNSITKKQLSLLGLRNPVKIALEVENNNSNDEEVDSDGEKRENNALPESLQNYYKVMESRTEKFYYFVRFLLSREKNDKVIVFFNTCDAVNFYHKILSNLSQFKSRIYDYNLSLDIDIKAMHGKMKQKKRNKIYSTFLKSSNGILICTDVLARGIDLPDVNWIIQFDPPQDPSFYIHRVGRTARAGREGNALLFLLKQEDAYIRFLELKNVAVTPFSTEFKLELTDEQIRTDIMELQKTDRDYIEKGKSAFMSFVRSYKEHDLKYIFEVKKLNLGDTANSFFLFTIPKIKEIYTQKIEGFQETKVRFDDIKFVDKNQEQSYLTKRSRSQLQRELKEQQMEKLRKVQEERKKRPLTKGQKKRAHDEADLKDLEEFTFEERLVKKLKKGLISAKEFKKRMQKIEGKRVDDDDDEDDDDSEKEVKNKKDAKHVDSDDDLDYL